MGFFILDGLWDHKDTWCDSSELLLQQQQQLQDNKNGNESPGAISVVNTLLLLACSNRFLRFSLKSDKTNR